MAANKTVKPRKQKAKVEIDNNILTLNDLVSDDHLYDELVKVEFPDGRYTFVHNKFRPSTVDDMLEQYGLFISEYVTGGREITEVKLLDYLNLHILLWFSKVSPDKDKKLSIESKIDLFEQILNSRIAETIVEAFDKDEIAFVYDRNRKKLDVHMEIIQKDKETRDKVIEYVKNSNMANKDIILSTILGVVPVEDIGVDEEDAI
jgi:hypothetical protein